MFTITYEWLESYRTVRGGYNRKQVEALGVQWPLVKGWKSAMVGKTVEERAARRFEEASGRTSPGPVKQPTRLRPVSVRAVSLPPSVPRNDSAESYPSLVEPAGRSALYLVLNALEAAPLSSDEYLAVAEDAVALAVRAGLPAGASVVVLVALGSARTRCG